jgi:hypothetical protein
MSEQKLTPELVVMAISGGLLDVSLDAMQASIRARKEILAKTKVSSMMPGDRFYLTNISPKYLADLEVEYEGRDGMWLQVYIVNDREFDSLNRHHASGGRRWLRNLKVRESQVGTFTKHNSWTVSL